MFGEPQSTVEIDDLNWRETIAIFALGLGTLIFGLLSQILALAISPAVDAAFAPSNNVEDDSGHPSGRLSPANRVGPRRSYRHTACADHRLAAPAHIAVMSNVNTLSFIHRPHSGLMQDGLN